MFIFDELFKTFLKWFEKIIWLAWILVFVGVLLLVGYCSKSEAQPLKEPNELVIELHHIESCFKENKTCDDVKLSSSILSGKAGPVQLTAIYKLTGSQGKLGGQAWFKLVDHFWVGAETVANFEGDADHEIMGAFEYSFFGITCFTYGSMFMKTEHLGGIGQKCYNESKTFSLGMEYKTGDKITEGDLFTMVGIKIGLDKITELFDFLNLDKKELENK